ncbi:LysM-like peptidoglycan-binding domain-containing protein [Kosakonia sp.]|uniref:LysM-like peptidoglycan-binding domain-containing protein n=1 Tax=Kosakonia sp. TaxID=1916651 RepID=UPI0028982F55|nr:LysM-like peptidoglycan-binding domain-containing protein [Kosakonia sp.]
MPGRFELKPTLAKIWHAPDHFRLMDPLPPMHRRGVILAALLVVIGFLLPSTNDNNAPAPSSGARDAQLNLPTTSQTQTTPVQPTPPQVVSEPQQSTPSAEDALQQQQPVQQQTAPAQNRPVAASGIEQQWRTYRVEEGKTLAQLFRDHNLPPTDVYAMAKVEGEGKPLSSLQSGQMVKIRQNANGVVTGLTIETGGQSVLFTRQLDGSFIRAR